MSEAAWIQVGTTIILAMTQIVIWLEIRAATKALHLSTFAAQHEMFSGLTEGVTDGEVQSFLLQRSEHFSDATFADRYEQNDQRIRSYILMRRKYLYVYFLWTIGRDLRTLESETARRWVEELGRYHEFRDVHEAQKRLYDGFGKFVDGLLKGTRADAWMCGEPCVPTK